MNEFQEYLLWVLRTAKPATRRVVTQEGNSLIVRTEYGSTTPDGTFRRAMFSEDDIVIWTTAK